MTEDRNIAPRYLRMPQAEAYTGFKQKTLYRLVAEKRIPFIRKGRTIIFDRLALDKWMASSAVQPLAVWE